MLERFSIEHLEIKQKVLIKNISIHLNSTDFAIVYAPTESLYAELSSYRDPKHKRIINRGINEKV